MYKRQREYIIKSIEGYAEYKVDPLGSVIAFKKGKKKPENKIMIDAHMDEVALIVTSVQSDGTLTVDACLLYTSSVHVKYML